MSDAATDLALALELFRDPILAGAASGVVLGVLSLFVILRRMVFVSATLSQAAGLGVALGLYAEIHLATPVHPVFTAVGTSLLAALVISRPPEVLRLSRETVLATMWLIGSGGAVLVGDRITQEAHDISGILFGSAVLVTPGDLGLVLGVGAVVLVVVTTLRRPLVFAGYDPDGARVQGLPVALLDLLLLVLLTVEVSVCTRALGALPVFAFSVLPGMAALLVMPRLGRALAVAGLIGGLAGLLGYLCAFFLEFPVGASQTAVAVLFVLLALPMRRFRR